jgi:hypothetical protein
MGQLYKINYKLKIFLLLAEEKVHVPQLLCDRPFLA